MVWLSRISGSRPGQQHSRSSAYATSRLGPGTLVRRSEVSPGCR